MTARPAQTTSSTVRPQLSVPSLIDLKIRLGKYNPGDPKDAELAREALAITACAASFEPAQCVT